MNCCSECFSDPEFKSIIKSVGLPGLCDFSGQESQSTIDVVELSGGYEVFDFIEEIYEHQPGGEPLFDVLQNHWKIFNNVHISKSSAEKLLETWLKLSLPFSYDKLIKGASYSEDIRIKQQSNLKQWIEFKNEIRTRNRFLATQPYFPTSSNQIMDSFSVTIEKDEKLYRGRIKKGITYTKSEMGKPPRETSTPGRANPEGIPYLYLGEAIETVIAEVRPTVKDTICIGKFVVINPLNIFDLTGTRTYSPIYFGNSISDYVNAREIFHEYSKALSSPIRTHDSKLDYLPSQYLAELIKKEGFDGIRYQSSLKQKNMNIVLFSDSKVICDSVIEYEVKDINYDF